MKKLLAVLAVFGIFAASFTFVGTAAAQGETPPDCPAGGRGMRSGRNGAAGDGPLHDLVLTELADAFGTSVEDLQAQLDAGEAMFDIAAGYGYDADTFRALMNEVMASARETAIAEGLIPEGTGPRGGGFGGGEMAGLMHDAIAAQLGLTAEELQARIDAGETMQDIAAEMGFSAEEIARLMQAARAESLQAAVDAGLLTQEQADLMLERGPGGPGHGGRGLNQQP